MYSFLGSVTKNHCDFNNLREPCFNKGQFSGINLKGDCFDHEV